MPRVLADGRIKVSILTAKPADWRAPTATELNGGIDVSCKVLADDFAFSARDSDKVGEAALCETTNAQTLGRDNYELRMSLWRYYLTGGGVDTANDTAFTAVKTKGSTLYVYMRKSDKLATTPWATGDEIAIGAEVVTDNLQNANNTGFIKWTVPFEVQGAFQWGAVTS